jgi:hypothetical protein
MVAIIGYMINSCCCSHSFEVVCEVDCLILACLCDVAYPSLWLDSLQKSGNHSVARTFVAFGMYFKWGKRSLRATEKISSITLFAPFQ